MHGVTCLSSQRALRLALSFPACTALSCLASYQLELNNYWWHWYRVTVLCEQSLVTLQGTVESFYAYPFLQSPMFRIIRPACKIAPRLIQITGPWITCIKTTLPLLIDNKRPRRCLQAIGLNNGAILHNVRTFLWQINHSVSIDVDSSNSTGLQWLVVIPLVYSG